jgi:protein-L-isoaspartate(D-aspartate) O-methyltransferase
MRKSKKNGNKLYDFFHDLDRSVFIDNEFKEYAFQDSALPIGFGQTISQPSLVYEMTAMLELEKNMKVLEIGTGSGYQTALLAEFAGEVHTVEIISELSIKAEQRLQKLGYENVKFRIGDGCDGWAEHAPYDRIIVTAGAGKIPAPLVEQLKPGGRMVIPVGVRGVQDLLLVWKDNVGNVSSETLGKVVFVELVGESGWQFGEK